MKLFKKFAKSEDGASMVEYGLALLVVVGVGTVAMTALGDATRGNVETACDALDDSTVTCTP